MSDACMDELEAIKGMLQAAAEYGLEAEVVREAMRVYREVENLRIEQACTHALVEWDI